jgi:hypothetical protein
MRLVGERRAVAAAVLAFFSIELLLGALLQPDELRALRFALGVAYFTAFVGVVSGWFWARWYTLGLAFSGVGIALTLGWKVGLDPVVYVLGGCHLAIGLGLLGDEAAAFYDGRKDWRERWKMDQNAVNRLGKAVMRAGASLPYLIIAGLVPKGMELGAVALVLGVAGIVGLVRLRTWGVLALGGAGIASAAHLGAADVSLSGSAGQAAMLAAALLLGAFVPFAGPIARSLRGR